MTQRRIAFGVVLLGGALLLGCSSMPAASKSPSAAVANDDARRLPVVEKTTAATAATAPSAVQVAYHAESTIAGSADPGLLPGPDAVMAGPVSVEELVALARANNPEIRAARYKASSMLARVPQARSFDDPMLSATTFLEQIQTAAGPQEAMLGLSQKFPWFGKRAARGEIACHDAQVAFAELTDVELGTVEQVKLAYYDLYFLDESDRVYRELKPRIDELITIARSRYETNSNQVGLESVLQAQIRSRELDITLVTIAQGKKKAVARLAKVIHLPRESTIDIQPQMDRTRPPRGVDVLVAMLDRCQPRLDARREAITRDQWGVDLAKRNYFPDVTVGFNWNAIGEHGLSAVANGQDAYSLAVGLNVPIYLAKRRAGLREARMKYGQSSQEYDATWDALREQVERLHADIVEQDEVLRILDEGILTKAQQTLDLSIAAYRVGRIGFQQLIDNYDTLLRLEVQYYMRLAGREQAIARLERSVGCAIAEPANELQEPGGAPL